jgi:hypothetical protein
MDTDAHGFVSLASPDEERARVRKQTVCAADEPRAE